MRFFQTIYILLFLPFWVHSQSTLRLNNDSDNINLLPYLEIYRTNSDSFFIKDIIKTSAEPNFEPLTEASINYDLSVHWIKFKLFNEQSKDREYNISVTFTDYISFYSTTNDGKPYLIEKTGDKVVLSERSNPIGKMVFLKFSVPSGKKRTYYLKLASNSAISQQFKPFALSAVRLYSAEGFKRNFETVRIYQALFYGAIIIMLIYNFFIFISLKDKSYLYYVNFIFFLIVFLAADDGFLAEIFFDQYPRWDLYIRFVTTPLLIISFLLFSNSFLQCKTFLPQAETGIRILIALLFLIIIIMVTGNWKLGRSMAIIATIFSFITIITLSIRTIKKGYKPARYFLYANLLLLVGGMIFAIQRYVIVAQNPLTQFSIQISAALQVALFSLGLADRINLIKKDLLDKTLENERLERQKEIELKNLIEEKNLELEYKVKIRTAEVIEQKEEIEVQNESLELYTSELEKAQSLIEAQNKELSSVNNWLEVEVSDRTNQLELSNEELQNAIKELDNFVYKTAHDIRGPLARLMGLCNVALLDVTDKNALTYLKLLDTNAQELNTILSRLSTIYKINNHEIENEAINLKNLVEEIIDTNKRHPNFSFISFNDLLPDSNFVNCDLTLLKLILDNLIENSIKYADPGKEHNSFITIYAQVIDQNIEINIIDNGIGINKEQRPSLFEMFSPAADVHKTPGLGLYMVKISAEKLNGNISLNENMKSKHTHFVLRLPLNQSEILESA